MNCVIRFAGAARWFVLCALALLASAVAATPGSTPTREEIFPGLFLIKGCVNTAVFERNGRTLLIDSGELTAAPNGGPVDWVLVTHHHRDQASHVDRLVAAGAKLVVPAVEEKLFSDAEDFWKAQRHTLTSFRPSRFTRRESVPVARTVRAGDTLEWEGLKFQTIETPGHTDDR